MSHHQKHNGKTTEILISQTILKIGVLVGK